MCFHSPSASCSTGLLAHRASTSHTLQSFCFSVHYHLSVGIFHIKDHRDPMLHMLCMTHSTTDAMSCQHTSLYATATQSKDPTGLLDFGCRCRLHLPSSRVSLGSHITLASFLVVRKAASPRARSTSMPRITKDNLGLLYGANHDNSTNTTGACGISPVPISCQVSAWTPMASLFFRLW